MKNFTFTTLTIFCVLAFASFASPQAAGGKIAVINTPSFAEAGTGITKYVNAIKNVETEFAPAVAELKTMATRLQSLEKEINALRQLGAAADQQAGQRKVEEYEKLQRDYKFKEEDVKSLYQRRYNTVTEPLNQAIGNALNEYGKQKGFALIFDVSRDTSGVILAVPDEKIDITKDFIAFFNAKP